MENPSKLKDDLDNHEYMASININQDKINLVTNEITSSNEPWTDKKWYKCEECEATYKTIVACIIISAVNIRLIFIPACTANIRQHNRVILKNIKGLSIKV